MTAWYNEIDPYAAQWLRNLIAAGHIAPGVVDERSIEDVRPDELSVYTQCHFFAGIGTWSHCLRAAGWSDDRPVWTGSEPCQPFSAAGKGLGIADERYLRPAFHHCIEHGKPSSVPMFFEQVANGDGLAWFDTFQLDMEATGHSVIAFDLCAAGAGAPHIRQRLIGMAYDKCARLERLGGNGARIRQQGWHDAGSHRSASAQSVAGLMVISDSERKHRKTGNDKSPQGEIQGGGEKDARAHETRLASPDDLMGDASHERPQMRQCDDGKLHGLGFDEANAACRRNPTNGFWRNADWIGCRDGKFRPVESGAFPLANGVPARVGRLRAYGNGIVAPLVTLFIETAQIVLAEA